MGMQEALKPGLRWEGNAPMRTAISIGLACLVVATAYAAAPTNQYRNELEWREVKGVRIPIPPSEHPRLYLRQGDLAELPRRLAAPELQKSIKKIRRFEKKHPNFPLELDALDYLVTRDKTQGRKVVEGMLAFMKGYTPPKNYAAQRATRPLVSAAIVYDWCYDILTAEEKNAYVAQILRLAALEECGYPPHGKNVISGHPAEAMIMRDMLSASIAIYDEFPEMYETIATLYFGRMRDVRDWIFKGRCQSQGGSYGPGRFSWETYPLWIFARMGAGTVYEEGIRYVPYYWIYGRRPDGSLMRGGDDFAHWAEWGKPWPSRGGAMFIASFYGDDYIQHDYLRSPSMLLGGEIFRVLWHNFDLHPKAPDDLPLTLYCSEPFGWMIARSGWDDNSAIVEMKINVDHFGGHQHLDGGAFQIYYRGGLALDSGDYWGSSGKYGSPHNRNYYWRTIAHNSLLIYNPTETNQDFWKRKGKDGSPHYGNDGGQFYPNGSKTPQEFQELLDGKFRCGEVLSHGFGPDPSRPAWSHLKGNIAQAYGEKARDVVRSFVYLNTDDVRAPGALVVFDRVVSSNPAFRKFWLLHTQEEPTVAGDTVTADRTDHDQRGRLVLTMLAPRADNRQVEKIGGPGKEYWVFGKNWPNDILPKHKKGCQEDGNWRIQVSPRAASAADTYLNVMQMLDRDGGKARKVERIDGTADGSVDGLIGCRMGNRVVTFHAPEGRIQKSAEFSVPGEGNCRILVTDLEPGTWKAIETATGKEHRLEVAKPACATEFEGAPGAYRLER